MKTTRTDVLVIGSGVGGLCAAAHLVKKGLKVLVAEKLPYVGGRFSSREYKGYQISTGAIMVPYGDVSAVQQAFDLVQARMHIRSAENGFRFRLESGDYDTSLDQPDLTDLLRFAMEDDPAVPLLGSQFMRSVLWSIPEDTISFRDWVAQYTDNRALQNHYQGFCGAFLGVNSNEVTAAEVFHFMKNMAVGLSFGIAVNGNLHLMNALADGIREAGGEVRTRSACKAITVEHDRVTGAVLETDGTEEKIQADFVVSNAGPSMTVQLTGESCFEKSYLHRLRDFGMITPVIHVCLASREPLIDFDGIINFGNTRRLVFFQTPTLTCPELAPDGMHYATTYSVPKNAAGPLRLRETVELIKLDLQDNFPGFKEAELLMVATHHGEWPSMRRWPGYPMPVKTPIQNLYNVGDGCMPRGTVGVEASALSAREAATDIAGP
jgi:phytoene dehydrogenase-like protein